ncbi:hypothetical protein ACLOJK_034492, partial [Asimina triloba]
MLDDCGPYDDVMIAQGVAAVGCVYEVFICDVTFIHSSAPAMVGRYNRPMVGAVLVPAPHHCGPFGRYPGGGVVQKEPANTDKTKRGVGVHGKKMKPNPSKASRRLATSLGDVRDGLSLLVLELEICDISTSQMLGLDESIDLSSQDMYVVWIDLRLDKLVDLPGVDVKDGIRRIMGKTRRKEKKERKMVIPAMKMVKEGREMNLVHK